MTHSAQLQSDRCRIYIVDDEWIIAQSLASILALEGYHTQAFHNPGQALVRSMECPPDVLIADVMMPGMTGVELAVSLRRAGHEERILLFSGQSGAEELLAGARLHGYDFELLEKPVHPAELLLLLRNRRPRKTPRRRGSPPGKDEPSAASPSQSAA